MACQTCGKVVDDSSNGLDFRVLVGVTDVVGKNGVPVPLQSCMVVRPHQPRRGWQVRFRLNGQEVVVPGNSPKEVFRSATALLRNNDEVPRPVDLWLNMNIQWLRRTPEKHHAVDLQKLFLLSVAVEPSREGTHSKQRWPASDWFEKALWFVGVYLSGESYDHDHFKNILLLVVDMCDPSRSPLTGSPSLFSALSGKVSALSRNPAFTREAAREWLTTSLLTLPLSGIGKSATVESVAAKYHWT